MNDPIVRLQSGDIRGVVEKHEDGFDYHAFKGIPYAEPPVGELRFEDPIAKKPWTGMLDCKSYGERCLQYDIYFKRTFANENCLHLNVFSRSINKKNERYPVMFVINGGAFVFGSSCDLIYGPDHLIRKNVVVVTFNYRLGVLGFLNLEHEVAPGNQGLKDQLLALQWVQQNIRQFGGDPGNVTVLGISAGAVAAHYLSLSPLAKGLFHKVIFQGATAYTAWASVKNPKSIAIKLCSFLGKDLTDAREILQFLKSVDAEQLLQAQESLRLSLDYLPFGPGLDDKSSNPVMPIHPELAASRAVHIPCLVGYNSQETILLLMGISRDEHFARCDADFQRILAYNARDALARHDLTARQVRRLYYKSEGISCENVEKYVDLTNDLYFVEGVHRFARVQAERGSAPTYMFVFSYDPPDSLSKRVIKDAPSGASHLDELPYFFKMRVLEKFGMENVKKSTVQYRMMEQVTEMWTNFAIYGNPTVDQTDLVPVHWAPIQDGTMLRYLNIDEDITMQSTINVDQKLLAAKDIPV